MSYQDRLKRENYIYAFNEVRRLRQTRHNRARLADWFYKDIDMSQPIEILNERYKSRTESLIKNGWMDKKKNITDLGIEKLVQHLLKIDFFKFNS